MAEIAIDRVVRRGSPPKGTVVLKVRLPERVVDEIDRRTHGATAEVSGGLLIGYPTDGGYWVERILACRNAAAPAERRVTFAVEPRALANVRATLAGTPFDVLGLFYGGGVLSLGERPTEPHPFNGSDPLRLVPTTNGHGRTPPRVWRLANGSPEAELDVEIVPEPLRPIPFCPE